MILLGFHVAGLAKLIRKYLRIPYIINLVGLYLLLLLPLWLHEAGNLWILSIGSSLVLLASLIPLLNSKEYAWEGHKLESAAPAHIMLVLVYLLCVGH